MGNIEKNWFKSFWIFNIMNLFSYIFVLYSLGESDSLVVAFQTGYIIGYMGIGSTIILIWVWITYHFALRKRGTKWLAFLLIILPIRWLKEMSGLLPISQDGFYLKWAVTIAILSLYFWFWKASYRLRKENLDLKLGSNLTQRS